MLSNDLMRLEYIEEYLKDCLDSGNSGELDKYRNKQALAFTREMIEEWYERKMKSFKKFKINHLIEKMENENEN